MDTCTAAAKCTHCFNSVPYDEQQADMSGAVPVSSCSSKDSFSASTSRNAVYITEIFSNIGCKYRVVIAHRDFKPENILLETKTQTSYTYDDFAEGSELDLGSKDATDGDAFHQQAYSYWQETQEYTLANLNTVYNDFKCCTSCVDCPTYQDGYFIGDDGTDDDDLINQCWKFYSHDSFNCDADCVVMGAEQGSSTMANSLVP